uniref:Uncharacterized protein n=1 Tax=Lepeophtheirus salmonis TaxID=72036 RepID=A0A0K2UAB1_LEPSM
MKHGHTMLNKPKSKCI